MDLRKEAILEAIIREYTESGIPVGSLMLTEKYSLPFSSATVRAEMSELERHGYLTHPHTSAGRIPTEKGYRYFVGLIEGEKKLAIRRERAARKRIHSFGGNFPRQLDTASVILAELTSNLAFAGTTEEIYSHGLGNLFSYPELLNPAKVLKAAELIDNLSVFLRELPEEFGTKIYVGSEVPVGKAAGCSVIVSEFVDPMGNYGYLGIIGPTRMEYEDSVSAINEIKKILEENYEQKRLQA